MHRCLAVIATVMLVCAARADTTEPVRVTASVVGNLRPGQTATITWTVTGTRKPVRLQLTNTNPESGVLEGGNLQTATTSGGNENIASRKVTGLAPGSFNVAVKVDAEHEALTPKDLAVKYRRELLRVAAQTKKAVRRLPIEGSFLSTAEVLALLDQALDDIERSLPYPELAAFRDAARAFVDELRREAIEQSIARRKNRNAIFLVSQSAPSASRIAAKQARSLTSRFTDWLNHNARISPVRSVCVVTEPTGANVLLYPSSFPAERNETRSIGSLTLYLGLYVYEIDFAGRKSRGIVDLLKQPGSVLQCLGNPSKCNLTNPAREKCP